MIPLLAYVIVQSHVPRIAGLIYYMQHYRLARMVEGSVYSFVITTMKSAVEFLKDDPLSLNDLILSSSSSTLSLHDTASSSRSRTRSTSFSSNKSAHPPPPPPQQQQRLTLHHRKSLSADLYGHIDFQPTTTMEQRRNSAILRPHTVVPSQNRKSLDITNDWLLPQRKPISRPLNETRPMVSTTFPSLSNSTPLPIDNIPETPKLGRSLSASTVVRPPKVINIRDRVVMEGGRPASICLDTRSLHSIDDGGEESEELMGDFLLGLSKLDGNVVGSGSFRSSRK
jgi:hypothetical protein